MGHGQRAVFAVPFLVGVAEHDRTHPAHPHLLAVDRMDPGRQPPEQIPVVGGVDVVVQREDMRDLAAGPGLGDLLNAPPRY
jgi:hypothetical protein